MSPADEDCLALIPAISTALRRNETVVAESIGASVLDALPLLGGTESLRSSFDASLTGNLHAVLTVLDADTEAAAHFELGTHLRELGRLDDARQHFRAAHELDPDNWSFKRQSWYAEDPLQRPTEHYESDFVSDIRKIGAENYYRASAGVRAAHGAE